MLNSTTQATKPVKTPAMEAIISHTLNFSMPKICYKDRLRCLGAARSKYWLKSSFLVYLTPKS